MSFESSLHVVNFVMPSIVAPVKCLGSDICAGDTIGMGSIILYAMFTWDCSADANNHMDFMCYLLRLLTVQ